MVSVAPVRFTFTGHAAFDSYGVTDAAGAALGEVGRLPLVKGWYFSRGLAYGTVRTRRAAVAALVELASR